MSESPLITVRASSLSDMLDCALRWYYKNVEGVRDVSRSQGWLGTSVHRATGAYDQARLDGDALSVDDAAGIFVDALHSPNEDVDWGDESPAKLEPTGIAVTTNYCRTIAQERDYSAVELTCDALDVTTDHGIVRLTGTTDRVRRHADRKQGISDLKTGKTAVSAANVANTKGHRAQLGVYTLLAESATGERMDGPAEIIGLQTNSKARVAAADVPDPAAALVGTDDRPGLIEIAGQMAQSGLFPPNPRSMLCSEKWCPAYHLCPYHE